MITRARQLIMLSLARFITIEQEKLMSDPTIADNKPVKLALDKDKKYYFCMCGLSSKQPFCDGSHKGGDFTPMAFQGDASTVYYRCRC
jgi:CDGSH-type Zn-finger protein